MGRREISTSGIILIILVSMVASGAVIYLHGQGAFNSFYQFLGINPGNIGGGGQKVEVEEPTARFSVIFDKESGTGTLIASETGAIWADWNGDGIMQTGDFKGYSSKTGLVGGEIEQCSSVATTALMTSPSQYRIDDTVWVFIDTGKDAGGRAYQLTYKSFLNAGTKDSNGVIHLGTVYARATEDAFTSSGLVGATGIDDATDYNYTLNGAEDTFELRVKFATADTGFLSGTEPTFWAGSGSYYNWVDKLTYAPTFIGFYMTNQDFIDLGVDTTGFDLVYQGASNTYCAKFVDDWDNSPASFYDSSLTSAPSFTFNFGVDITAAGAITYIGLYQDVEWSDFVLGIWGDTTDNQILGTQGADWDWVA